jgi:hypothetical protein
MITSAGVPVHTISPPAIAALRAEVDDPVGARITSRLCSMTTSEWPASSRRRKARSSFAMSSKCRPVVGSSKRNSVGLPAVSLGRRRGGRRA